jgi:hypothetical protein
VAAAARVCPTSADIKAFNGATASTKRQVRDDVIDGCIQAIDNKYDDFKQTLQRNSSLTNFTIDVLGIGLSGGATLAKKGTTQALSAASSFVQGIGTTFNKDLFYQQTLPALEASMDTRRSAAQKAIVDKQAADPDASKDSLSSYGPYLDDYQAAGSLYGAIAELTSNASAAAQTAKTSVAAAQSNQRAAYTAVALGAAINPRLLKLTNYVRQLPSSSKSSKLDPIATKVGVAIDPDFQTEQANVVTALAKTVESATDQNAAMTKLEADLGPLMT